VRKTDAYEDVDLKNESILVFEKSDRYKELMFVKAGNEWAVIWKAVKCIWEGEGTYSHPRKAYGDLSGFADGTVFKIFIEDRGNITVSYYVRNGNHLKKLESRFVSESGKYFNEYNLNGKWVRDR